MDYDPNPSSSSSYGFDQFQSTSQSNFDQQFAAAEKRGGNNSQGMALASMIIGIVGFVFYVGIFVPIVNWFICGITLIMAIIGIVLAAISMKKISSSKEKSGFGFAIAGLVLNIVQGLFSLIGVALIIMALAFAASIGMI